MGNEELSSAFCTNRCAVKNLSMSSPASEKEAHTVHAVHAFCGVCRQRFFPLCFFQHLTTISPTSVVSPCAMAVG